MRYKTPHSSDSDYVVYRKFTYNPRSHGLKGVLATIFTALAIFILLPLPDDLIIVPAIAKAISHFSGLPFIKAATYGYLAFESLGVLFLVVAVILGGSFILESIKANVKEKSKNIGEKVKRGLKSI